MNKKKKIEYIKNRINYCKRTGKHKKIQKELEQKLALFYKKDIEKV